MTEQLRIQVLTSLADVTAQVWNACVPEDDPFTEHAFLAALERSGSVGGTTGWLPRFVVVSRGDEVVGGAPVYLKDNSYGEYIFDWGWAGGAEQAGIAYYPKLVVAVPFTPATGSRLLVKAGEPRGPVVAALIAGLRAIAEAEEVSSIHVLFCPPDEVQELTAAGFRSRYSFQFHWQNRTPAPYAHFDDFLQAFRSENRKQVRKERRTAQSHGLTLTTLEGPEMGDAEWRAVANLYDENADKHGAITYLTPSFFEILRQTYAHRVVTTFAYQGSTPVAGTLNFQKGRHIYGRYWGAEVERPMLHFELCYYQLIERAIAQGLVRFEAGAQGEHKLKRGLMPTLTHSAHWIRHPGLDRAVAGFLSHEAHAVKARVEQYAQHGPYQRAEEAKADTPP
ncbi:MAG: GNAT family N-acetyltransferase [Myxococcales bacterium]|nr:GNAT family N-acetyltransferase [Myxococcales bacterium]